MAEEPKPRLLPVEPCTLPINNPSLKPQYFGEKFGWAHVRVPCKACGVQYDRREVEEYTRKYAMHVAQFVCPMGHLNEERRIREPVPADAADV
jgi:hypothetical protein